MQPGAVSFDVNLAAGAEYYIALSNYGTGSWDWQGPFMDGREILGVMEGNWLSPLGNLFVAVAAYDGAAFDLVGVGAQWAACLLSAAHGHGCG